MGLVLLWFLNGNQFIDIQRNAYYDNMTSVEIVNGGWFSQNLDLG